MRTVAATTGVAWPLRLALAAAVAIAACSPTLDWRETRPEGSGATLLFPCRPEARERPVRLGDATVPMRLLSCAAGGVSFALVVADAPDPGRVSALLAALRAQAIANVAGAATPEALPAIAGATANSQSARLRIVGRRPDGQRVVEHALFFVKGVTIFQATVIGADEPSDREAVDTFFGSIRFP